MTVTAKCLVEATQLTNAQTTLYTASAATGARTILDKITATNVSGSTVTITVNVVASGGTAGGTNTMVSAKSLQAGESYGFPELVGQVLNASDFVSVLASASTSINFRMSGREVTQ